MAVGSLECIRSTPRGFRMLHGIKTIAEFLGCSEKRVRSLVLYGLPVRVTGYGHGKRYIANQRKLSTWLCGP
jgi:hypothetical protein